MYSTAVSGSEVIVRMQRALNEIFIVARTPITYIIVGAFIAAVVLIITGSIIKSGPVKSNGFRMLGVICIGTLLYYCIPLLVAFLNNLGNIMNGG